MHPKPSRSIAATFREPPKPSRKPATRFWELPKPSRRLQHLFGNSQNLPADCSDLSDAGEAIALAVAAFLNEWVSVLQSAGPVHGSTRSLTL